MPEIACQIEVMVPFYDIDTMRIVWHGNYVKYMEQARCALLDQIEYNYEQMEASGYTWPVVDMRIKYVKPLVFKQQVIIHAEIAEKEYGLKIVFTFFDKNTGKKLTTAYTKQVAVDIKTGEMCLVSPQILHEKIDAYLA